MSDLDEELDQTGGALVREASLTLYVFGIVDARMAQDALVFLHELEEDLQPEDIRPVTVHIQTDGGDVDSGLSIYDALRAFPRPVVTVGHGLVASIGVTVYLAGDRRLVYPHTRMMQHPILATRSSPMELGDMETIAQNTAWMEDREQEIWIGTVHRVPAWSTDELARAVWWNGGEELVAQGIATELIGGDL